MKRVLIAAVTVLFFLILLALLAGKLFFSGTDKTVVPEDPIDPFQNIQVASQPIHTDSPYRAAYTCYTWYLGAYAQGRTIAQIAGSPEASQCFTSAFLASWEEYSASTGVDPVLHAQDLVPSWASSMTVSTVSASVRTSDQEILLGTGAERNVLIAHLAEQEDGSWKIGSVSDE